MLILVEKVPTVCTSEVFKACWGQNQPHLELGHEPHWQPCGIYTVVKPESYRGMNQLSKVRVFQE